MLYRRARSKHGERLPSRSRAARTWVRLGLIGLAVVVIAGTFASLGARGPRSPGSPRNAIVVENQHPGSEAWHLEGRGFLAADDRKAQIKGYASLTSVDRGQRIVFYVTLHPEQSYTIGIYRMGWYGGAGGRLMTEIGPLAGVPQPACPVDAATGLISCAWSPSHTFQVPREWTSGVYLAVLTNASKYRSYIGFVVRNDERPADFLYQQAVLTYQAYNNYPDDGATGKSLYDANSNGTSTVTGTRRAAKVSFDRPYAGRAGPHGSFLRYETSFIQWLERSGYDVVYATDLDTHSHGDRLRRHKGFLSVAHDEYWTKEMVDAVEAARDAGVHLAFLGANAVYWQVRLEPSRDGVENRVVVCYKDARIDPVSGPTTTVMFRDPMVDRPEQRLVGIQYTSYFPSGRRPVPNWRQERSLGGLLALLTGTWEKARGTANVPYRVTNPEHWVYAGTGLEAGQEIPGIVGYEGDRRFPEYPEPIHRSGTYAMLGRSPFRDVHDKLDEAQASIYQAPSGAWVFAAGTISWSWALGRPGFVDPRLQRTTANLLDRFSGTLARPLQ